MATGRFEEYYEFSEQKKAAGWTELNDCNQEIHNLYEKCSLFLQLNTCITR